MPGVRGVRTPGTTWPSAGSKPSSRWSSSCRGIDLLVDARFNGGASGEAGQVPVVGGTGAAAAGQRYARVLAVQAPDALTGGHDQDDDAVGVR